MDSVGLDFMNTEYFLVCVLKMKWDFNVHGISFLFYPIFLASDSPWFTVAAPIIRADQVSHVRNLYWTLLECCPVALWKVASLEGQEESTAWEWYCAVLVNFGSYREIVQDWLIGSNSTTCFPSVTDFSPSPHCKCCYFLFGILLFALLYLEWLDSSTCSHKNPDFHHPVCI